MKAKPKDDKRNLGRLGESTLENWAAQRSLIVNRAFQDEGGWDFLVEWPSHGSALGQDHQVPLDRRPAPLQCLVQVKATDSRNPRPPVKLNNWVRLIRSPLPVFFLLLQFDGGPECRRAHLVHVWEHEMRRILRRLRELSVNKGARQPDIRKRRAVVTYDESHLLHSLDGVSLAAAIEKYVGEGVEEYAPRKINLLKEIGYEDGGAELDINFRIPEGKDAREYLVDFALGLVSELDIEGSWFDMRFGTRSIQPVKRFDAGSKFRLADLKPVGKALIRLRLVGAEGEAIIPLNFFMPRGIGAVLPREHLKILMKRPFLEFVFQTSSGRATYNFSLPELGETHSLVDCRAAAVLLRIWTHAANRKLPIEMELSIDGEPVGSSRIGSPPALADGFGKWAELVMAAWAVARHFDVDQDVNVMLSDLIQFRDDLELMAMLLKPDSGLFRVEYSLEEIAQNRDAHCIPLVTQAAFGGYTFQVAAVLVGRPDATKEDRPAWVRFSLEGRDIRLVHARMYREPTQPDRTLHDIFEAMRREYEDDMTVVVLEQYQNGGASNPAM